MDKDHVTIGKARIMVAWKQHFENKGLTVTFRR
jgi:hypothetical protein